MDLRFTVDADQVTVAVSCTVHLGEVSLLGVPGTWMATASASEPLDQWRENSGEFGISDGSGDSNPRVGGV